MDGLDGLCWLQQLEVELLPELTAELGALGPDDLGVDQPARGEVQLDLGADRDLLAAFDQRSTAGDVAEARAADLALVMEQASRG